MATQRNFWTTTIMGAEDLSDVVGGTGPQFKALTASGGVIAANGLDAIGIIQYPAQSGEHVTVGILGEMKYVAGAAITPGQALTVGTSGYFLTVTSAKYQIGRNLENSVASGAIGRGFFNFGNPILVNCVP